jgi:hypothetical protein
MSQRPRTAGCLRRETPCPDEPHSTNCVVPNAGSTVKRPSTSVKRRVVRPVFSQHHQGVVAHSDDGIVTFTLIRCPGGILVERARRHVGTGRSLQSMEFRDSDSFARWSEADRLQFAYPLLYTNLRRRVRALFNGSP